MRRRSAVSYRVAVAEALGVFFGLLGGMAQEEAQEAAEGAGDAWEDAEDALAIKARQGRPRRLGRPPRDRTKTG